MILSLLSILKGSSLSLCVSLSHLICCLVESFLPLSSSLRLSLLLLDWDSGWQLFIYLGLCFVLLPTRYLARSSFSLNLSTHLTPTAEVYNLFDWSGWVLFRIGRVAEKFMYVFELKAGGFRQDIVFYFHFRTQDEMSLLTDVVMHKFKGV